MKHTFQKFSHKEVIKNKPVFITGFGGSGKSTFAKKLAKKHNYLCVEMDEIIRHQVIPSFPSKIRNDPKNNFFRLYRSIHHGDEIIFKAKMKFARIIKKIIKENNGNVVFEGFLESNELIRSIFGNNDAFIFIIVRPKNLSTYSSRVIKRFQEDPELYGRLGFLKKYDQEKHILKKYQEKSNKVINKYIHSIVKTVYPKRHDDLRDSFIPHFIPFIHIH